MCTSRRYTERRECCATWRPPRSARPCCRTPSRPRPRRRCCATPERRVPAGSERRRAAALARAEDVLEVGTRERGGDLTVDRVAVERRAVDAAEGADDD